MNSYYQKRFNYVSACRDCGKLRFTSNTVNTGGPTHPLHIGQRVSSAYVCPYCDPAWNYGERIIIAVGPIHTVLTWGEEWILCDTPLLVQKFVRLDLPIFRKATDRAVIVIEEEVT